MKDNKKKSSVKSGIVKTVNKPDKRSNVKTIKNTDFTDLKVILVRLDNTTENSPALYILTQNKYNIDTTYIFRPTKHNDTTLFLMSSFLDIAKSAITGGKTVNIETEDTPDGNKNYPILGLDLNA